MSQTTPPALNSNNIITDSQEACSNGILHAPPQPLVDILLPRDGVEVGLGLGEDEGVDTTVKVREAGDGAVAGDHEDGAVGAVFGDEAGGVATERGVSRVRRWGNEGIYLVERTIIQAAFCSKEAATAAMAQVSEVPTGRTARLRSSLKSGWYEMADSASKQVSAIMWTAASG